LSPHYKLWVGIVVCIGHKNALTSSVASKLLKGIRNRKYWLYKVYGI